MEKPILNDKNIFPTDEIIFSHIGRTKTHWIALYDYIHTNHPDFSCEWRYYNDGYAWLYKITRKAKTVFWCTVIKNSFKITFYFADKAEPMILASSISDELKKEFLDGKHFGKIRALTIQFKNKKDIEFAKEVIGIKLKIK